VLPNAVNNVITETWAPDSSAVALVRTVAVPSTKTVVHY